MSFSISRAYPPADTADRARAAATLRRLEAGLAGGTGILARLGERLAPGIQYPEIDVEAGEAPLRGVWDAETDAQFFYHRHPEGGRFPGEHGHFHLFLGEAAAPDGITPLLLPEMALAPRPSTIAPGAGLPHRPAHTAGGYTHLVAVSVDGQGRPIGLFATNRWVTGETWYRAPDVRQCLRRFLFAEPGPVEVWLAALVRLLAPTIEELLTARDAAVMDWRRKRSRTAHVFEDRRLEICAARDIDFTAELNAASMS